jgi:site-specific recombinase XerD
MLEQYFARPESADRLRAMWLGSAFDHYAEWLASRQTSKATALRHLQILAQFNSFVKRRGVSSYHELPGEIDPFVRYRMRTFGKRCRTTKNRRAIRSSSRVPVEQLLRLLVPDFRGTVRTRPWPLQVMAPGFLDYLRDERGIRPDTIRGYEHHLRVLERFLDGSRIKDPARLTPVWITQFLTRSTARLSWEGRQGRCGALRVLLRYLHRQGLIATDLSRAVPRGRKYKLASIPRAIPWNEVERVLTSIDRRSVRGKRDYAILMLLATYGLRAQDIAQLELAAIDWQRSQFHVLGRKAGNSTTYPLAASVGEAIIEYLRVRPQCADRHVFVTLTAPYHSISHWGASTRAGYYLRRAGITVRRPGSHTFRHSCVQRLVEADVPFKQIGDYVGHRSDNATQIYAKVAIHKLRALALGEAEDIL